MEIKTLTRLVLLQSKIGDAPVKLKKLTRLVPLHSNSTLLQFRLPDSPPVVNHKIMLHPDNIAATTGRFYRHSAAR